MSPDVSVVVPTYGRPDLLARCLAHLARQDLADDRYEVIVIDDGSGEKARLANAAVVSDAVRRRPGLPVRYLWKHNRGPAAARNTGWRIARAPVIAFTDDDTEPAAGWLREGLLAMRDRDAVAGRIVMPLPSQPTDYERDAAGLARAMFVTANCFVRRGHLEAIGGFDERFRMAWREDADLQFLLEAHGARLGKAPRAVVVHPIRPAPWGVSLRQQRKVLFDALLYKKHPKLYRQLIRPVPPWDYYVAVGALIAALVTALEGVPAVAGAALAVWATVTARFCWRRLASTSRSPAHVVEMIATSALIPPLSVFWRLLGAWRFRVLFL